MLFCYSLCFQTVDDFEQRLKRLLSEDPKYEAGVVDGIMPEGYLEAPLAYDAIWAVALGGYLIYVKMFLWYNYGQTNLLFRIFRLVKNINQNLTLT